MLDKRKGKCHIYLQTLYTVGLFPLVIFNPGLILDLAQLVLCAGATSVFTLRGNLKSILPVWGPLTTAVLQQIVFHPDDWALSTEECRGAELNYQASLLTLMLSRTSLSDQNDDSGWNIKRPCDPSVFSRPGVLMSGEVLYMSTDGKAETQWLVI